MKPADSVKLLEEQLMSLSEGEAVVFQLPGYANKKEKHERFYSTPFYSHPGGYKMCIRIHANGDSHGKGIHVSILTKILKVARQSTPLALPGNCHIWTNKPDKK